MVDPFLLALAAVAALSLSAGSLGMVQHQSTRPERLAEHPLRRSILRLLEERPGACITDVCQETGAAWGTIQHHVYMLERAGLVRGLHDGGAHRLFANGHGTAPAPAGPSAHEIALLRRGRILKLVLAVLEKPGIGQRRLTQDIVMGRKTLRRYVDLLAAHDLIQEEAETKLRRYYPTARLVRVLSDPAAAAALGVHGQAEGAEAATPTTIPHPV